MSRRSRSTKGNERRAKIKELLQVRNIESMADIQDFFKESIAEFMEKRLCPCTPKEWQQRPLESTYAVVFLDAIHYHVRSEGQIVKKGRLHCNWHQS